MELPHLIKCHNCRQYFNPESDKVKVLATPGLREKDNLILVEDIKFLCHTCSDTTAIGGEMVYEGELVVILDVT